MSKHTEWKPISGTATLPCLKVVGGYPEQERCGKSAAYIFRGRAYCEEHAKERMVREAAPELLEALRKIVSLDNDAHPGLSTWHDFRVKAHKEAETAIAKAERRT